MIYEGNRLKEIAFPLGGIGTGSICIAGNGRFINWEIFGRPDKKSINGYTHFAVRAEYPDGRAVTKILNTDLETDLAEKGKKWTDENLFNGEYFIQKIDITDKSTAEHFDALNYWNEEAGQLKYQIADGCEIDQMVAQWHASLCGIGDIFDKDKRKTALQSMIKYNFKESMRNFINPWRVFALGDESAAVMCDYPAKIEKPVIPVPYCEEAMTGFEYAFAGLLAQNGMTDECIKVVKAIRARYDGEKRNPWDELECGHNYARTMASFALLPIFSGFSFDMPNEKIGFDPIRAGDFFRCPFSVEEGWGEVFFTANEMKINIHSGSLTLCQLGMGIRRAKELIIDGKNKDFINVKNGIEFDRTKITSDITVKFEL